jgi:hypothetical protein
MVDEPAEERRARNAARTRIARACRDKDPAEERAARDAYALLRMKQFSRQVDEMRSRTKVAK